MDSDRFNEPSTSSIIRRIVTGWTANRTIPTPEREAPQSIVQTNRLWNEDSYNQRQTPLRGDRERQAVLLPKQMELTKPPAANAGTIIPGPVALEPSWKTPAPDPKHRNTGILESIPVQPLELRSRPVDRETVDCVHPPEE